MRKGFFVPNSVSSDYVANKKTSTGAYQQDQSFQEIGLGKQAAFQSINQEYAATINNAYSSYLAANRGIEGSQMGEGYKQAYGQIVQDQLVGQITETNLNAANVRNQINQNASAAETQAQQLYEAEVANMDRVARTANDYLGYLKSLTNSKNASQSYLSPEQSNLTIDDMYDSVFAAQPKDYLDAEGNIGMSYIEWLNSQMKDNTADLEWSKWLFGQGGFNQFKDATKRGVKK